MALGFGGDFFSGWRLLHFSRLLVSDYHNRGCPTAPPIAFFDGWEAESQSDFEGFHGWLAMRIVVGRSYA